MKQLVYIPLDERPCNLIYPQEIVSVNKDIHMVVPSMELLGKKKQPANIEGLWAFLEKEVPHSSMAVLSMEMLFYGGLLPSRLHHYNDNHFNDYIERLKKIIDSNRHCKFYAFQLIMRTPRYSSDDEEPDYYGTHGREIFLRSYYRDKKNRFGLNSEEEKELAILEETIPISYIKDYEDRRRINISLNQKVIEMVENGYFEMLSIPQDDSCEFGYTAMDQKIVVNMISSRRLQSRVLMYPGADEAGSSLVALAVAREYGLKTKVYPFYASTLGPTIVPLYEDRIMHESLKSHLTVCDCEIVADSKEADFILAINAPGKVMQEAFDQSEKDITYSSYRNINWFCKEIKKYIDEGKKVVLADCAFANGGDLELIALLDEYQVLDKLISYKAWNTHCNTLGTSIAQMVLCNSDSVDDFIIKKNILVHIIEDGFYQAFIRKKVTASLEAPLNYFDLCDQQCEVVLKEVGLLKDMMKQELRHSFKDLVVQELDVYHPWNRMFEIGVRLCVSSVVI